MAREAGAVLLFPTRSLGREGRRGALKDGRGDMKGDSGVIDYLNQVLANELTDWRKPRLISRWSNFPTRRPRNAGMKMVPPSLDPSAWSLATPSPQHKTKRSGITRKSLGEEA